MKQLVDPVYAVIASPSKHCKTMVMVHKNASSGKTLSHQLSLTGVEREWDYYLVILRLGLRLGSGLGLGVGLPSFNNNIYLTLTLTRHT
jgi:hypothetical protein